MHTRAIRNLAVAASLAFSLVNVNAQQVPRSGQSASLKPTPAAATAPTPVPALVPYSGIGIAADGKAVTGEVPVTFLIYKDQFGGQPLFAETQTAAFDTAGRYEVQLGASLSSGIPLDLFSSGEARWLEVQIAGAEIQPRALLVSVPYALKAGDAATLGGLPASAYVLAGSSKTQAIAEVAATTAAPSGVTANTGTNVTTTGGTSGYLPVFNGAATVVDSILFQSSTGIGIGDTPNSSYKLDVNGKSILRGTANLPNTGTATTSAGTDSFPLTFNASAYNSSSKAAVTPIYYWQAEPQNNNTASPGATLNLLYNGNNGAGAETGLYLNSNGTIHFPSAQTFSATGASVAFNGTSTSGLGVEGTSTSGSGIQGSSTSGSGVYAHSTSGDGLLGVTAGTTVHTAGVFGIAGTGNTSGYTGIAGVWGDSSTHAGVLGTSSGNAGVQGISAASYGLLGTSNASSGGGAGVYGYASTGLPGVKGASATGDGGDFYGGGGGYGIQGIGASSSSGVGEGGNFVGGAALDGVSSAGDGLKATGGNGSDEDESGDGLVAFGGFGEEVNGGTGGVFNGGESYDGTGGDGVYVSAGGSYEAGAGLAGYFAGNVVITGTTSQVVTNSRIDHPLDPANKYLNHTSIESSEMVNIYSGNVITDEQGLATVKLPSWFETVNGDLRYQLTMVGAKAQAWISKEVKDGEFQISSDAANAKVSWQITGVRQDAYAKAHPLVVEQTKDVHERGFYQNPELYGQPAQKQTEWGRHPNTMKTIQRGQQNARSQAKTAAARDGNSTTASQGSR